ncbi:MAG: polynucleotide adenylyltransferase PcnB [Sphaerochaetaceae bacterium]|nr:polynucleotide adenylyltransferase PcnB [Sphaerochaetaceae bacterium]MDD4397755.1 polynucleotide adenylyltransferase PcnB [Sphaerochaetaceae bacterium]
MRIRYKKDSDGLRPVARIYTKEEHRIDSSLIDQDAVRAISRLKQNGFSAYIVGGAVRDILLGRVPKDFDIATSASPRQVHKLFYQARVIGKRFKLVHLVYGQKIIEVSTFRGESNTDDNTNNVFGTIETDAKRRDFTINSLYYDPIDETLVDFNNSMEDFKHKRIHSVLPLSTTFTEDPVRMIRALKYSVTTGFKMDFALKLAIRRDARLLAGISNSRLTEEVFKILTSGCSAKIIKILDDYSLLVYIMPCLCVYTKFPQLYESLSKLDAKINDSVSHGGTEPDIERWEAFQYLTENFIVKPQEAMTPDEHFKDVFRQVKVLIAPITPPNFELERAVTSYMKQNGYQIPRGSRYRSAVAQKTRKPRQKTIRKRTPKKKLPESLQS